jgi:8-oxo-dGTP pyrophosphatase MutT (NUDIX family)
LDSFENTISTIRHNLYNGLPGNAAHNKMSPITRKLKRDEGVTHNPNNLSPRKSAVLVHLYPEDGQAYVTFIKRAPDNTVHSGQISFPGGKTEDFDSTYTDTALREAEEEVNIAKNDVIIIGELSKIYIPPSNFDVYPFIGYTKQKPDYKINDEVERLVLAPLDELLNDKSKVYKTINHRSGNSFVVPSYKTGNDIIWGATAMILSEFLEVVKV